MHSNSKIKVGLVQVNNSFSNQNYFPYSVGILQAYAEKYLKEQNNFEFLLPIYSRVPVNIAVEKLLDADIVFFSIYLWNRNISLKIAEEVKKNKPETVIVFGGPQVPNRVENFLRQYNFIDITCHGEGEIPFLNILKNYSTRDWKDVPSISYLGKNGEFIQNPMCNRIANINEIPSPYLTGVFDPLMKANPQEEWLVLWETNRGCPFSCAFCDWGSAVQGKIYSYNIERLVKEIDWFSEHQIEFVFCCDANFGILKRDIELVEYMAENKRKHGYPKSLSIQNTKNSTQMSYKIQKILDKAELNKGVTLSVQSMNKDTLKSINRNNISMDAFQKLQKKFANDDIKTYTDVILGLPNETYESFKEGISYLIENGQHNRIQFNNLNILPNSKMNEPEYQDKYGFITQETKIINIHGVLEDDEISETQQLVIGTSTMPKTDWVKTWTFSWMAALLHFDKILQIPFVILNNIGAISYRDLIEIFSEGNATSPIISEIRSFFIEKAREIQNGGAEYCHSKDWLNIWWPTDEFIMIKLCTENKLDKFYEETEQELRRFIDRKNIDLPSHLLDESIYLNQKLIKLPFQNTDVNIQLSYNIFEVYQAALKGKSIPLEKGTYEYQIERKSKTWSSWEEWCKEVVWYENKKGAYLYSCYPVNQ